MRLSRGFRASPSDSGRCASRTMQTKNAMCAIALVTNRGRIDRAVALVAGGVAFMNSGDIDGPVAFTGADPTNAFTNLAAGVLTGNFHFSSAASTLTNQGHVTGNFALSNDDTLTNSSDITEDVTLAKADTYDSAPGGSPARFSPRAAISSNSLANTATRRSTTSSEEPVRPTT